MTATAVDVDTAEQLRSNAAVLDDLSLDDDECELLERLAASGSYETTLAHKRSAFLAS